MKLKNVIIGECVSKIAKNAFKGSKKLKNITINSTIINSVGKNSFKGISKKATIYIKGTKSQYKNTVSIIKSSGIAETVRFKRKK